MRFIWALIILLITVSIPAAFAVECVTCRKDFDSLQAHLLQRDRTIGLLAKNERYLASLKAEEASKYLKVSSNVVMILKKLDGIRADTAKVEQRISTNGCTECRMPETASNSAEK